MRMVLRKLLAHGAIIISGMYIVFFFIDRVNPTMNFIDNDITKPLLLILGVISIINSIQVIAQTRKELRRRLRKQAGRNRRG